METLTGCACTVSTISFDPAADGCDNPTICGWGTNVLAGDCMGGDWEKGFNGYKLDCLAGYIINYNSPDCSGGIALAIEIGGQCIRHAEGHRLIRFNMDCKGNNNTHIENEEECKPVREPSEGEECFVSLLHAENCATSEQQCFFERVFPHNQCVGFPDDESSFLVDCINKLGMKFPSSANCEGSAVTFGDGLESNDFLGHVMIVKWDKPCSIEEPSVSYSNSNQDNESEEEDISSEDSEDEADRNDGDESQSEIQESAAAALSCLGVL